MNVSIQSVGGKEVEETGVVCGGKGEWVENGWMGGGARVGLAQLVINEAKHRCPDLLDNFITVEGV